MKWKMLRFLHNQNSFLLFLQLLFCCETERYNPFMQLCQVRETPQMILSNQSVAWYLIWYQIATQCCQGYKQVLHFGYGISIMSKMSSHLENQCKNTTEISCHTLRVIFCQRISVASEQEGGFINTVVAARQRWGNDKNKTWTSSLVKLSCKT